MKTWLLMRALLGWAAEGVVVDTGAGLVKGFRVGNTASFFTGIPFALPPTGLRRFAVHLCLPSFPLRSWEVTGPGAGCALARPPSERE